MAEDVGPEFKLKTTTTTKTHNEKNKTPRDPTRKV
jgi:hypothetical protein